MTTALFAIIGGLSLAAFIIFPMGVTTTSGTRFAPRDPFRWSSWRKEACTSLWALNPVTICRDVWEGYEDVAGGVLRLFAFCVVAAALLTAVALVGWGLLGWLLP
jgi:hypothetical protein